MSPPATSDLANESKVEDHDVETTRTPLLPEAESPKRYSLLSNAAAIVWNSCLGCALTGAVFLTVGFVTTKKLANDSVSVFQSIFIRGLIALPVLVPIGYFRTGFVFGPMDHNMKWILLRGTCGACSFLFGFLCAVLISLSEAALFIDTYPAVLAFMSWALGIESIDILSWCGIFGAIGANFLIVRPPFLFGGDESIEWDTTRIIGLLCSFLCVCSAASGYLIVGKIDKSISPLVIANHAAAQLVVISIPFMAAGFPEKIEWKPSAEHVGLYLLTACGTLNQIFMVRAFQIGPPVKAAMCVLSRVLMIALSGIIFFSEQVTLLHAAGGVLLLSSIALVIWRKYLASKRAAQQQLADEMQSDHSF